MHKAPTSAIAVQQLIELLNVKETSGPEGLDHYIGDSQDLGYPRVFGGQVLGQALVAACKTVSNRLPHSLHAYFLRPGDPHLPISYHVDRIRDGHSFTTRRVVAKQKGEAIFNFAASFQVNEPGVEHQMPAPQVTSPDTLESELSRARKVLHHMPEALQRRFSNERPIEVRAIDPVNYFQPKIRHPKFQVWIKSTAPLPDDPIVHRCFLAYASDLTLLEPCLFPHGLSFITPNLQIASLDHAMWFHRDFRIDDWLLYEAESPTTGHARGFSRGLFFDQNGRLVASTCQEGLMRLR